MITDFKLRNEMHIHLVGIGGSGISAIARVLLGRGFVVSGSDMQANELTAVLATEGATIFQGHRAENIVGADALVISSAVPDDNPEVAAARAQGIPVLKRADLLGHLHNTTYYALLVLPLALALLTLAAATKFSSIAQPIVPFLSQ